MFLFLGHLAGVKTQKIKKKMINFQKIKEGGRVKNVQDDIVILL